MDGRRRIAEPVMEAKEAQSLAAMTAAKAADFCAVSLVTATECHAAQ
jgi:hypothetical protein